MMAYYRFFHSPPIDDIQSVDLMILWYHVNAIVNRIKYFAPNAFTEPISISISIHTYERA